MQPDSRYLIQKASQNEPYEVGGGNIASSSVHLGDVSNQCTFGFPLGRPVGPAVPGWKPELPHPLGGFQLQPLETCPRNFIVFDRSDIGSRVMFHPALADKFTCHGFDYQPRAAHEDTRILDERNDDSGQFLSSLKEDSDEIDALLSSEDEGDDVTSTGRTPDVQCETSCGSSCSGDEVNFRNKLKRPSTEDEDSYASCVCSNDMKRQRMKRTVDALKGIVPGGEKMDSLAVIDEAVKYLKSLKAEAEKLGVQSLPE